MARFPVIATTFAEYETFTLRQKVEFWVGLPSGSFEYPSDWPGNIVNVQRPLFAELLRLFPACSGAG